jgi:hypothetical protein
MFVRAGIVAASAAVAATMFGCSQQAAAPLAVVKDRVYTVTPDAMKVKAGLVTGEVTQMKITERVEEGTGRIASAAKLTGTLVLKNVSSDQTVRLLGGKIRYIDPQGKTIKLEDNRTEPMLRVASQYGNQERLDPGQFTSQSMEAEFPAEALQAKRLKEIRVELSYIPSFYREETLNFAVSIGGQ